MKRRTTYILTSAVLAVVLIGVVAIVLVNRNTTNGLGLFSSDTSILNKNALKELPTKAASMASLNRIAEGVQPPTNSWISGLALQEKPLAVFPMPLSIQALDTGFQIGLPTIVSDAKTITGGHVAGIEVLVEGATQFQLSRFDKTSASLTYSKGEQALGKLTIAQGSPYVFYRAGSDSVLRVVNTEGGKVVNGEYTFKKGIRTYSIATHSNAKLSADGGQVTVTVPKGGLATFYALPEGSTDMLAENSGNEVTGVKITHEEKDGQSLTKFKYETANQKPTVVSTMAYQTANGGEKVDLAYQSIYGDMQSRRGNEFTTTVPLISASNQLSLGKLSDEEKRLVISDLQADSQDITIEAQDSYFAGKQLARAAMLYGIAKQLDQADVATQLESVLKREFSARLGKNYFYYDTDLKGVAALTAAFGSEDFNDHHFHYGYFIYAASILGKYDKSFVDEYKDEVNLLVADIASYETYPEFPVERTYDPYSAHSWAAGLSPFQDGNNQESSSEALNAYNGVALWAEVIGNKTLKQNGQWMLSNETATANTAWRSVDTSASYLKNYTSPVASLNFGGKRTYSTFFSDESNTKLGIQLIPMSPVMETFKADNGGIKEKLAKQDKPNNYNVALGDYLLMYLALSDKAAAIQALDRQTDEFIDDGNSRTYLRAWIYSQD
ncbi:MAG: Endo,3(4)-beta-glucanase [Candidatus Saccharibacteria bacterium]|nr:Endo,3(4)-beta-glucanase [Candidatus Saccharibacteria bacterium]